MTTISNSTQNQIIRLGKRLRRNRTRRGLTMAVFARQLGISVATLRRMERGRPGVSIGRWVEILRCLNGANEVDRLLSALPSHTAYIHQDHPRGLRQRTV